MKILIASDLHGAYPVAEKITEMAAAENCDRIILLGDIYYHGPRNPLPDGYAPLKVAELLNKTANLAVLKGNCDAEVDQMISDFKYVDGLLEIDDGGKKLLFTHGHEYNDEQLPKGKFDLLCYGHFHVGFIKTDSEGHVFANPGSPSLPKDGFCGYLLYDNGVLSLKDMFGNTQKETKI